MHSVLLTPQPYFNQYHHRGRKLQRRWRRSMRLTYLRFKRLKGRPEEIARGIAVGAFTGVMPLFGVQTFVAIAISTVIRGNPLTAAAATWISNPITFLPLYMLNFRIGQQLLGTQDLSLSLHTTPSLEQFLRMGLDCITTLTVGCLALGIPLAAVSYILGLSLTRHLQQRRRKRKRHRRYTSVLVK